MKLISFVVLSLFALLLLATPIRASVSVNTATVNTANDKTCGVRLVWPKYNGERAIKSGKWDGTYTVFLFPYEKTRDEYVAKKTVVANEVTFADLVPEKKYSAEVFLTGAFLESSPFWQEVNFSACTPGQTLAVSGSSGTTTVVDETKSTTPTTLPDTGWSVPAAGFLTLLLIFTGIALFKFFRPKKTIDKDFLPEV